FGWVIGAEKGVEEANRGAAIRIPKFMGFVIRYVTPSFLLIILCLWLYFEGPGRVRAMIPSIQGQAAVEKTYADAVKEQPEFANLSDEAIAARVAELFAGTAAADASVASRPEWIAIAVQDAVQAKAGAEKQAMVAAFVFVCVCGMFILIYALSDIACRNRIGRMLAQSEAESESESKSGEGI
ncbi:MAG: hypothetical protein IID41_09210, partial [Planctomycetes bacterium]|nr:hypothetical protein [Planctomycetota bacterium]